MSRANLADFLSEVRLIHRGFNQGRSSLRPLLEYLDAQKDNPVPLTSPQIYLRLGERHRNRWRKYMPAIRNLVFVWGKNRPYPLPSNMGQEIPIWGTHANCYAYAFECSQPVRGNHGQAWPGVHGGQPLTLPITSAGMIQAVQADGGTMAGQSPDNPPPDTGGTYLIAALSNDNGFHFIRRDGLTGCWSWKDGNAGSIKLNIWDSSRNLFVYITDDHLRDFLVVRRGDFNFYPGMVFNAFFRVPDGANQVEGRLHQSDGVQPCPVCGRVNFP